MEFFAELHPKIVHFPIALFLTYVLFEVLYFFLKKDSLNVGVNLLLFLGVLSAIAAVITGNQASEYAEYLFERDGVKIPFGLMSEHQTYATWTLFWFSGILIVRTILNFKKKLKGILQLIILVLSLIGAYLIYQTGNHGGELVYEYGVGTKVILPEGNKKIDEDLE